MKDIPFLKATTQKTAKLVSFIGDINPKLTYGTISDGTNQVPCIYLPLEPGVQLAYANDRCYIDKGYSLTALTEELAKKYNIEKHFTFR